MRGALMKWGYFIPIRDRVQYVPRLAKLPNVYFVENSSIDGTLDAIKRSGVPYTSYSGGNHIKACNTCLDLAENLGMDRMLILHSDDYPTKGYVGKRIFEGDSDFTFHGYRGMESPTEIKKEYTATGNIDNSRMMVRPSWVTDYLVGGCTKRFGNMSSWVLGKEAMTYRFDYDLPRLAESDFIYKCYLDGLTMEYWSIIGVIINLYGKDRVSSAPARGKLSPEFRILEERYRLPQPLTL